MAETSTVRKTSPGRPCMSLGNNCCASKKGVGVAKTIKRPSFIPTISSVVLSFHTVWRSATDAVAARMENVALERRRERCVCLSVSTNVFFERSPAIVASKRYMQAIRTALDSSTACSPSRETTVARSYWLNVIHLVSSMLQQKPTTVLSMVICKIEWRPSFS
jgi:hypothetical protein